MVRKTIFFITILLLASCHSYYSKQLLHVEEGNEGTRYLIQNVSIFNGKDSVLIKNQDVLIEHGQISSISPHPDLSITTKTILIDGAGKTLMPGFIDAHVHLSGSGSVPWENIKADVEYNLRAYLYAGITTVYDLGGLSGELEKLAIKAEKNELLSPTIFHTHIPITIADSHPIPLTKEMLSWPLKGAVDLISPTVDSKTDFSKFIKKYSANNVDYIKIICDQIPPGSPEMSFELMEQVIKAAHQQGYKVFVHIGSPRNAINALKAGADVLAHGIWRGELTPEQADTIISYKKPIIYTLAAFQNVNEIHHGTYKPNELDTTLVPSIILDPVTKKNGLDVQESKTMDAFFSDVSHKSKYWANNFDLLKNRGAKIIVGTDSSLPGTYAGTTFHQEITALSNFGLSNYQILSGATYQSANLFLSDPDFGTVEQGKIANLLLIDGNPLENLDLIREPKIIFLKGQIINRH